MGVHVIPSLFISEGHCACCELGAIYYLTIGCTDSSQAEEIAAIFERFGMAVTITHFVSVMVNVCQIHHARLVEFCRLVRQNYYQVTEAIIGEAFSI